MEEFIIILIVFLIVFLRIWHVNHIRFKNEIEGKKAIKKLVDSGEWLIDSSGQAMPLERASYLEKVNDPDYRYTIKKGLKTELQLSYMSLSEIKEVVKLQKESEKIKNEEKEKENEKKKEELRHWRNPINHFQFEINDFNGKKAGIYTIYNKKSTEYYIGSSVDMYKRKFQHLGLLRKNVHPTKKLQRSYLEFGEDSLLFYALMVIDFDKEAKKFEHVSEKDLNVLMKKNILENYEQEMLSRFKPQLNGYLDITKWKSKRRKYSY